MPFQYYDSKFYRCVDNGNGGFIKYEFQCGPGTVWDQEIQGCNHAWAVKNCGGSLVASDSSSFSNQSSNSNSQSSSSSSSSSWQEQTQSNNTQSQQSSSSNQSSSRYILFYIFSKLLTNKEASTFYGVRFDL